MMTHPSGASWASRRQFQPKTLGRGVVRDGRVEPGGGELTLASLCAAGMMVFLDLKKGYLQPGHEHPDHESLGYVISGKIRMVVAGTEAVLEPGDSWRHPRGSFHITEALENSTALELHMPLRHDILDRFHVPPSELAHLSS